MLYLFSALALFKDYIARIFEIAIIVAIFWYFFYAMGAVDAPDWHGIGQATRAVYNILSAAWEGFWAGFDQSA